MDKEEEDYFESGNDDEEDTNDNASTMGLKSGLGFKVQVQAGNEMIMDSGDLHKFPRVRIGGSVVLNSASPLVLNPLVDYDLDDTGVSSPDAQQRNNTLYSTNTTPPLNTTPRKPDGS